MLKEVGEIGYLKFHIYIHVLVACPIISDDCFYVKFSLNISNVVALYILLHFLAFKLFSVIFMPFQRFNSSS